MSQIIFDAKYLDYEEWLIRNPDVKLEEETCDECDGSGFSECFHCGHEIECEICEGSGVANSAREQYEQQLKHDKQVLRKYADWLARDAQQRPEAEPDGQICPRCAGKGTMEWPNHLVGACDRCNGSGHI